MLEISWKGTKPVPMPDGTERRFINDGDNVKMRGSNGAIGFGEVSGELLPAL
jgi:fumarylacetoacetase